MQLRDPAFRGILERGMVGRIATVSKTGRPHVNPLYYYLTGGHIHMGTAVGTLAAHNVRTNPDVQIVFEIEPDPTDHRQLRIDGTAVVRTEPEVLKRYVRAIARKYILTPGGLWNLLRHPRQWDPMRRHVRHGGACVIDVTPTAAALIGESVLRGATPAVR